VGQERLDLGEELGVVVDVLEPLRVDARLVGELGDGAVLARVDVERPLGDGQRVAGGPLGDGRGVGVGAGGALDPATAARSDAGGEGESGDDEGDEACQFFELDSKNLTALDRTVRPE
jgi:hypothetical protein